MITPDQVYTTTLTSGQQMVVVTQADFGDIIITALVLALITIVLLNFSFRLVYRQ